MSEKYCRATVVKYCQYQPSTVLSPFLILLAEHFTESVDLLSATPSLFKQLNRCNVPLGNIYLESKLKNRLIENVQFFFLVDQVKLIIMTKNIMGNYTISLIYSKLSIILIPFFMCITYFRSCNLFISNYQLLYFVWIFFFFLINIKLPLSNCLVALLLTSLYNVEQTQKEKHYHLM